MDRTLQCGFSGSWTTCTKNTVGARGVFLKQQWSCAQKCANPLAQCCREEGGVWDCGSPRWEEVVLPCIEPFREVVLQRFEESVSKGWVFSFLKGAGLRKLLWMAREHGVSFDNVFNLDDAFVNMCPSPDRRPSANAQAKIGVTVTVVTPMGREGHTHPILSEFIVKGETERCLPQRPWPAGGGV
eukprot:2372493-Amphidinium_carterae.3